VWVLLIVVVVVALLLLMRVKFRASYDSEGFRAYIKILFIKIKVPPEKKKEEKKKEKGEKKGAPMSELKDIIGLGFKMLGKALKLIRIDNLSADVVIASDDAFKTAMLFGGAAAGCGILVPPIEENFNIRRKDINVNADFEAKEILVSIDAKVSVAIWQLITLGLNFIVRYIKLKNQKEGKI